MRGKEHVRLREQHGARITPAYAGKRRGFSYTQLHGKDHPRTCGEKESVFPRQTLSEWITPAHAGKRKFKASCICIRRDHPRTCGEKLSIWARGSVRIGSPPHVRGQVIVDLVLTERHRITPACAGKRSGPSPAAVPVGPAGSCPASRPSQFPPRMTVISPRP